MSATLLEPPPPRQRPSKNPSSEPAARPARPHSQGRVRQPLPLALALSAIVHVLALLLIRFEGQEAAVPFRSPTVTSRPVGIEVVNIRPVAETTVPAAREPERVTLPARPQEEPPVRPAPAAEAEEPPTADRVPTITERISPRMGDPRLFAPPERPLPALVDREATARERLLARIGAYNDSAAAAAAAAESATDWTLKGANGERWGFSPKGIHLGSFTLPIPLNFAPPPGRREELAERNRRWGEIEGQRVRETGRATFDERVRSIRERNDAKRDSTRTRGSGGT
jgi:hypothetical protein